MKSLWSLFLALLMCIGSFLGRAPLLAETPRYQAKLADGTRVSGNRLHSWHHDQAQPQLEETPLLAEQNPLLWLIDRYRKPAKPPAAYVKMIGGDCLPAEVIEYVATKTQSPDSPPAYFLVRPLGRLGPPASAPLEQVRILARYVSRIVWQGRQPEPRPYQPATIFYRDGRREKFSAIRFQVDHARLLLADSTRSVEFAKIAEIHFSTQDPWDAYYDELAALKLTSDSRLLQICTTDGEQITGSLAEMQAAVAGNKVLPGDEDQPDRWLCGLRPAWSLDPIWLSGRSIRLWRCFAARQVPLSRVRPRRVVRRSALGGSWQWKANRNVQGGLLYSGQHPYGWGFGVQAYCELHFPLPPSAMSFQSHVGLDHLAKEGGCVRARVFQGSIENAPLYESPLLVGSQKTYHTGPLFFKEDSKNQRTLILQFDWVLKNLPPGAEPLDLRDIADWLDPVLLLDPEKLQTAVKLRGSTGSQGKLSSKNLDSG